MTLQHLISILASPAKCEVKKFYFCNVIVVKFWHHDHGEDHFCNFYNDHTVICYMYFSVCSEIVNKFGQSKYHMTYIETLYKYM